jgi:hypothetical protein
MNAFIFVLKLNEGKYYVGRTTDIFRRLNDHSQGIVCEWTSKYAPINTERIIENSKPGAELKILLTYMFQHGIDNVRGGDYVDIKLSDIQLKELKHHLKDFQMEI